MNSEPSGILRYYQLEKATTSELDDSEVADQRNKQQLQNPDEEITHQDATKAEAKSETVSMSVQVTSQKKNQKGEGLPIKVQI